MFHCNHQCIGYLLVGKWCVQAMDLGASYFPT
jgi:hypothetical protein